jgi:hypothetical protein
MASRAAVCLVVMIGGCGARSALETRAAVDAAVSIDAPHAIDAPIVARDTPLVVDAFVVDAFVPTDAGSLGCTPVDRMQLVGTWSGPVNQLAMITLSGDMIDGVWLTNTRPPFFGTLLPDGSDCEVRITFPDDATFIATLVPGGCTIDWSNGTVWQNVGCP